MWLGLVPVYGALIKKWLKKFSIEKIRKNAKNYGTYSKGRRWLICTCTLKM